MCRDTDSLADRDRQEAHPLKGTGSESLDVGPESISQARKGGEPMGEN